MAGVEWLIEEMGWRSVEDKLPENKLIFHNKYYDSGDIEMLYFTTDDVMVLLDSGKISKAKRISDDGDVWEWSLSKIEQEEIIYWREIP